MGAAMAHRLSFRSSSARALYPRVRSSARRRAFAFRAMPVHARVETSNINATNVVMPAQIYR